MISKDEQDTDFMTEEELLEIDSVDEHGLNNLAIETIKTPAASIPDIMLPRAAIVSPDMVTRAQKKPDDNLTNKLKKDAALSTENKAKSGAQSTSHTAEPPINIPSDESKGPGSSGNFSSRGTFPKKRSILLPIVSMAALGILGGIWYKTTTQLETIEKNLAETNQKTLLGVKEQDKALDASYKQLAAQMEATQKKQADMSAQQQEMQSTLSRLTGHKEDNWLLAEALYLSRLAVERLQTTQDVKTAIAQLTAADDRLRQVADPSLMPVRKILVDKIAELEAVDAPDFEGLWLQLGTISEMANKLVPIHADKNRVQAKSIVYPTGWKSALRQSWVELKDLVKVRSPQENASTPIFVGKTLSDFNEEGVKRGFKLFVEQARWALIQREAWLYQGSIDNAQKWLKTYFSQEATAQLMQSQLEQLKNNHIHMTVPDASSAVTAINNLIQQRQKLLES